MELSETVVFEIGGKFPIVGDEDFHQAGVLIALTTETLLEVDHAWQRVSEEYGYTTAHEEGAAEEIAIIKDQFPRFWSIVQQYLLPCEQEALWGWIHGKAKTEETQDALDALELMTFPI